MLKNNARPEKHQRRPQILIGKAALLTAFLAFAYLLAAHIGEVSAADCTANPLPLQVAQAPSSPESQIPTQPEDIPDLLQKLLNPEAQIRAGASQSLNAISPEIKIPALVQALSDSNWKIQVVAAYNLGQLGPQARSAIPALAEALANPNPDVRFVIAKALGQIGSEAAVPALAQALQDKDENVRMVAAKALDKMGSNAQAALPVLQKTLRDGNWFVRSHAAAAFVRLAARDQDMLPVILKALKNPLQESVDRDHAGFECRRKDEIPAVLAIDALAAMGPEVAPFILNSIQDDNNPSYYPSNVSIALATLGYKVGLEQAVESLFALFNNLSASDREFPLAAMGRLGFKFFLGKKPVSAEKVHLVLDPAFNQDKWQIRAAAVAALDFISSDAAEPYFGKALQDRDWRVRSLTAALRKMSSGLSSMAWAYQDKDWRVRLSGLQAISPRDQDDPTLLSLLEDQNEEVRLAAALKLTGESKQAQLILVSALQHHQPGERRCAILRALSLSSAPDMVPLVIQNLQDKNARVRSNAATALEYAGASAVPPLIKALQDEDAQVRYAAVQALEKIGSPAAAPALTAAVYDPDLEVRNYLGAMLSEFPTVIPEAINNLRSNDWQIRRHAADILELIINNAIDAPLVDIPLVPVMQALQDQNPDVSASVAAILREKIYHYTEGRKILNRDIVAALKNAVPNLLYSIKNGDNRSCLNAILVLGNLGPGAAAAIPALRHALTNENWTIRYAAAVALIRINPRETAVVPVLAEIYRDPDKVTTIGYLHDELEALIKIGSPEAISVLINLLNDAQFRYTHYLDEEDRLPAADALIKVGPRAIPALIAALKNENLRFLAADTLGQMGRQAISPLIAILKPPGAVKSGLNNTLQGKNADIHRSAVYALGLIGRKNPGEKKAVIKTLTDIMSDQGEPAEVRWLAAASLKKLGKNVDFSSVGQNSPNLSEDNCYVYIEDVGTSHFDLYAARCLFSLDDRSEGGGYELFQQVHNLLIKTQKPSIISPQSKPQPAYTVK